MMAQHNSYAEGHGLSVWLWGPPTWHVLHAAAAANDATRPERRRPTAADALFEALRAALPCPWCVQHYNELLPQHVKRYGSAGAAAQAGTLRAWVYHLHEAVNARNAQEAWQRSGMRGTYRDAEAKGVWSTPSLERVMRTHALWPSHPLSEDAAWTALLALARKCNSLASVAVSMGSALRLVSVSGQPVSPSLMGAVACLLEWSAAGMVDVQPDAVVAVVVAARAGVAPPRTPADALQLIERHPVVRQGVQHSLLLLSLPDGDPSLAALLRPGGW